MYQLNGTSWPRVDICFFKEAGDLIGFEHDIGKKFMWVDKNHVFPLQACDFGKMKLPVPKNPKVILDVLYPDWDSNPKSSGYCHRTDSSYSEAKEIKSVSNLKEMGFELHNVNQKIFI
jgi:hypothetical protein